MSTVIRTCPEAHSLNLDPQESAKWIKRGWRLVREKAYKTLAKEPDDPPARHEQQEHKVSQQHQKNTLQRGMSGNGYSEGGRLKADMVVDSSRLN